MFGCCGERGSGFYIGVLGYQAVGRLTEPTGWLTEKGMIFIAPIERACR